MDDNTKLLVQFRQVTAANHAYVQAHLKQRQQIDLLMAEKAQLTVQKAQLWRMLSGLLKSVSLELVEEAGEFRAKRKDGSYADSDLVFGRM